MVEFRHFNISKVIAISTIFENFQTKIFLQQKEIMKVNA
jgi:hypothetical protein